MELNFLHTDEFRNISSSWEDIRKSQHLQDIISAAKENPQDSEEELMTTISDLINEDLTTDFIHPHDFALCGYIYVLSHFLSSRKVRNFLLDISNFQSKSLSKTVESAKHVLNHRKLNMH